MYSNALTYSKSRRLSGSVGNVHVVALISNRNLSYQMSSKIKHSLYLLGSETLLESVFPNRKSISTTIFSSLTHVVFL